MFRTSPEANPDASPALWAKVANKWSGDDLINKYSAIEICISFYESTLRVTNKVGENIMVEVKKEFSEELVTLRNHLLETYTIAKDSKGKYPWYEPDPEDLSKLAFKLGKTKEKFSYYLYFKSIITDNDAEQEVRTTQRHLTFLPNSKYVEYCMSVLTRNYPISVEDLNENDSDNYCLDFKFGKIENCFTLFLEEDEEVLDEQDIEEEGDEQESGSEDEGSDDEDEESDEEDDDDDDDDDDKARDSEGNEESSDDE